MDALPLPSFVNNYAALVFEAADAKQTHRLEKELLVLIIFFYVFHVVAQQGAEQVCRRKTKSASTQLDPSLSFFK